jgi:CheY-like chemotaxis protein
LDQPVLTACLKAVETILLVDDEELLRDLGKKILERSGYSADRSQREGGLNLYETRSKISLVILDLIMPEMGASSVSGTSED